MAEPPDVESFREWDLGEPVQGTIAAMGITRPTPIQALAIGPVLEGRDVIAKAETGTGKTLAFGAPMIARIDPSRASVLGLVLSPTRELAEQVHNVLLDLGAARGIRTALIVGGEDMVPQVKALQAGAQIVVGTPGRVLDLMNQGFLSFPWTEYAVLDEADKMLEIGFIDDVKMILEACNEDRQTLLFSATFPTPLLKLAREYTRDPVEVATASGIATVDTIAQRFMRVSDEGRVRALARMIESSEPDDVFLVFCDRRTDVDRLLRRLERERFSVKALHGGYDQASRFRVMTAFRSREVKALLATDVASRGLDVLHVTHVVNYGVPRDVSDYTHRIGRTGRAGRTGVAVTLVAPSDERRWRDLLRHAPYDIVEVESPWALARSPRGGPARERGPAREGEEEPRRDRGRRRGRGGREREEPRERSERRPPPEPRPREEHEEREQPERPAPEHATRNGAAGFGAGVDEDASARAPRGPEPRETKRKKKGRKKGQRKGAPRADGPPGFGAGV